MTTTNQYRVDHRCSTCMAWYLPAYDYGYCHRHPHKVKKYSSDWCTEHVLDEQHQEEPAMYDPQREAADWYEYIGSGDE